MPKRKLADLTEATRTESSPDDRFLKIQTNRLTQRFELGVVALSRALKTARGFERQKLGRREKTTKSQEGSAETLKRLKEEIDVLKDLDPTVVAQKYLFKQLLKTKRIAETAPFVKFKEIRKISVEGPRSTAEANVAARLYKSNPVKNVFPGIIDGIRSLLGVASLPEKTNSTPSAGRAEPTDNQKSKTPNQESKDDRRVTNLGDSGESDEEAEAQDENMEDIELEDGDSEEEDFSHFDARIASDSGDDDSASGDDDSDGGIAFAGSKYARNRSDMSISLSPSPEDDESPPPKKQKAKGSSKKASATPATTTTFLPSLTMGGYWSGSESEGEDVDRVEEPPRRKNRMGQQARRALWEKKFGSGANHIKQQKEKARNSRDKGWDARRGATGSNAMAMGKPRHSRDAPERSRPDTKEPRDNKPLHPSWEAARKAKEQKASASFQGKKVVFD